MGKRTKKEECSSSKILYEPIGSLWQNVANHDGERVRKTERERIEARPIPLLLDSI